MARHIFCKGSQQLVLARHFVILGLFAHSDLKNELSRKVKKSNLMLKLAQVVKIALTLPRHAIIGQERLFLKRNV